MLVLDELVRLENIMKYRFIFIGLVIFSCEQKIEFYDHVGTSA